MKIGKKMKAVGEMKKRLLYFSLIMALVLSACGGKEESNYGIAAYAYPISPVSAYAPAELVVFNGENGDEIGKIDLGLADLMWDVDIVTTPDLVYGLCATSTGVFIFDIAEAEIVGKLEWVGEVPQAGVDIVVTPDGTRGIIAHGTQMYPSTPYLPATVTIFEIPSGDKLAEVPINGKKIPWDVDIQLTPNGEMGLVASTDQIIVFDTLTGEVISIFEEPGFVVPVGIDPVITGDGQTAIFVMGTEISLRDEVIGIEPAQFYPDLYANLFMYFMNLSTGSLINKLDFSAHTSTWDVDIKLTPDGDYGLFATSDRVHLFDARQFIYFTSVETTPGQIPQIGSDLVITPDGKRGIVAYGTQTYPPNPYMSVTVKIFSIPSGEVINTIDLNYPYLSAGIDITLTPDGSYALIPVDFRVVILETESGNLVSEFETESNVPQMGVDVAVTPNGETGIIATGPMLFPPQPYLPVYVEIFSIPNGTKIAQVDIKGGTVAWDVDIQISEHGETGYVFHNGYVTLFNIKDG